MISRLASVDYTPDEDCKDCPVRRECTKLILEIAEGCTKIAHKLYQAGVKIRIIGQTH